MHATPTTPTSEQQSERTPQSAEGEAQLSVLVLNPMSLVDSHRDPWPAVREEGFLGDERVICRQVHVVLAMAHQLVAEQLSALADGTFIIVASYMFTQ